MKKTVLVVMMMLIATSAMATRKVTNVTIPELKSNLYNYLGQIVRLRINYRKQIYQEGPNRYRTTLIFARGKLGSKYTIHRITTYFDNSSYKKVKKYRILDYKKSLNKGCKHVYCKIVKGPDGYPEVFIVDG